MTDGYLGDQYDAFGGDAGYPVPSWDSRAKGYKVRGIILPQPHPETGIPLSYLTTQQTSMPTDDKPSEPLFYDNDPNGPTFHKRPRLQAEFLLWVPPCAFEDCSDRFREFAEKNEIADDGFRRHIVKGATASKSMQQNGRKVFKGKGTPVLGAWLEQEFLGKRPKGNFKENVFEVRFDLPTPDSLAKVQEYMSEHFENSGIGDAMSGPASSLTSEPGSGSSDEKSGDDPDF